MDHPTTDEIPDWIKSDCLTDFIEELRKEGYKISISQYVAAQKLVLTLIDQGETLASPGSLGGFLGPIFCSSPSEQEDFQQRFKRWVDSIPTSPAPETLTPEVHPLDTKAQALSQELGKIQSLAHRLRIGALVGAIMAIALYYFWSTSQKPTTTPTPNPTLPISKPSSPVLTPSFTPKPPSSPSPSPQPSKPVFKPVVNASSPFLMSGQKRLIFFILAVPVAVFFYFFIKHRFWSTRADLFLQRLGMDREPKLEKIAIQGVEQNLFPPSDFNQIARGLKRRIRIPSQQLDVNKTIEATLKKGSWLSPVYGTYQRLVEYLFLVDSASFRDHQTKFMEGMINCLKKDGVLITVYSFEGDPRICFSKDRNHSPRKLQDIIHQYHDRCLIVVSDSDRFFSDISGELEPWVNQLKTWEKRAVLTPNPISNWSNQEFFLAQYFIVLPATEKGLQVLSQVLNPEAIKSYVLSEQKQTPLPDQLVIHPFYWLDRSPPTAEEITSMLESLEQYLESDGYYWFAACAVFPELHWNITLYLGTQLKTDSNKSLVEVCSPIKLARLPWFRSGYMPDWLRNWLISKLNNKQELTIRSALQNLLVSSVQGTVNQQQLEVATQYQKMLPDLLNPMLHKLSKQSEDGSPLRDYLFLDFMQGNPILATKVPDELRDSLKRKNLLPSTLPRSAGEWLVAGVIITGVTLLALFGLQQLLRWQVGALLTAAETTSVGEPAVNNVFEAITATGLSHSTLVQLPERPPFRSVEEGLLKVIQADQPQVLSHPSEVYSVAFSRDGQRIVSGSRDKTVRIWDAKTGAPISKPLTGHAGWVISVGFSPDGQRIVSGSSDKTVRIWDAKTGAPIGKPLSGHEDAVHSVGFSPDGQRIVSGSSDKTVRIWDAKTGAPIGKPLTGHKSAVYSVGFSPDGQRIVSGSSDKTVRIWNDETGAPIGKPLTGHEDAVHSVGFSPDGQRIVSGSRDKTVRIWDAKTGAPIGKPLTGHAGWVNSVGFSPDGQRIVSGSGDKTVRIWDAKTGAPIGKPLTGHEDAVWSVAYSPDGQRIVSGSSDKTVRIWEVIALWDNGKEPPISQPLQGHKDQVWAVAFSPDSKQIVSGGRDGTLRLWDWNTGAPIGKPLTGHEGWVSSVAFSPDGQHIVSGSKDKTVRIWDAKREVLIGKPLTGHQAAVISVAYSPDGQHIVSGSEDKTVRIWDAKTGVLIGKPLTGHQAAVISVAFSRDGQRIVSGSADKTVRIWDAKTGVLIGKPLIGHKAAVISVAFSRDGRRIGSGSFDNTVRIWDAQTGQPIGLPLTGHTVAFSPDGKRIVSGSNDKTLRLWDAETGKAITKPLKGHTEAVYSVAFSPDDKHIVSGSDDKTLRIWHISWEYLLPIVCNRLHNHPSLNPPTTDVTRGAKETCEHFVRDKPAESTPKPSNY